MMKSAMSYVLTLGLVACLFGGAVSAQSFILDENQATIPAGWPFGSSQVSVAFGGDYRHDNRIQNETSVEWNLTGHVSPGLCYEVAAIWNANGVGTRATNVRYEIDHDGGTAVSFQNQNLNTNTFNVLATAGGVSVFQDPTHVRVFTGDVSSPERYIIADAIMVTERPCSSTAPQIAPILPFRAHKTGSSSGIGTTFDVANITSSVVTISVVLFDETGNVVYDDGSSATGMIQAFLGADNVSYDEAMTGSVTLSFDLGANERGQINIPSFGNLTSFWGHGTISWSSTDATLEKAIVVSGRQVNFNSTSQFGIAIPVNGGVAF